MNLQSGQRASITEAGTGWSVGASFLADFAGRRWISLPLRPSQTSATLDSLKARLTSDELSLTAWLFGTTNYAVDYSHPAYLSYYVGPGADRSQLEVWRYDGAVWTKVTPG